MLLTSPEGEILTWSEKPSFEHPNINFELRHITAGFRNEQTDNLTELDVVVEER